VPAELGLGRAALEAGGFDGKVGSALYIPRVNGPALVALGVGDPGVLTSSSARDVAAAFARAAKRAEWIALDAQPLLDAVDGAVPPAELAQVLTEGILLAGYRYAELKAPTAAAGLLKAELVFGPQDATDEVRGVHVGKIMARTTAIARDLANTPASHLTATDFGSIAEQIGPEFGLLVDVFDKEKLIELGCGGLLGVNAGSTEEPRMIVLHYDPAGDGGEPVEPTARLAFVGKGITYDSGGLSLKPSTGMALLMKMDMAGAGAVFAAMSALRDLGCRSSVTGLLMCTDNMPSGSAVKLGDVLTIHGGTTVEVKNADAEGRLVMADALALASEEKPDAIVDIATLTGAAVAALGPATAAVFGNDQALVDRISVASAAVDEPVWQLPLERKYRKLLDSDVADMANVGGPYAGATTAALFLSEFVGETSWAHLDIAGTMSVDADDSWRSKGATGFGARLLVELAVGFGE
jgi:leucyl aminopeptidase